MGLYGIAGLDPGRYNMRGYRLRGEKRGRPNLGEHELGGCILVGNAIGGFSLEARIWETRQLRGGNNLGSQQLGNCILGGQSAGGLQSWRLQSARLQSEMLQN